MRDTIFALASARGKAGVAVIRVSGPKALECAAFFGVTGLRPRQTSLRRLMWNGAVLDEAIVVFFQHGASFTGEDVVEFHGHGSQAVVAAMLSALGIVPGCRLALPGEFTRRALENGRLDLTQVEGLADLIDAETEAQRQQAQRILSGALGERISAWRADLIRAAALIEASIDFVDEDVPVDVVPEVLQIIDRMIAAFRAEIDGSRVAERVRDGFEVAITGAPNAGKSTLLNAIAGREVAITSAIPGTTRDLIEVRLDIGGLPVTMVDTAGLRQTEDEIEQIGVQRARARAATSDLQLLLVGPDEPIPDVVQDDVIVVITKADVVRRVGSISAKTGEGMPDLLRKIESVLAAKHARASIVTNARQRSALLVAVESLETARKTLYDQISLELVAADLRAALTALEMLIGKIGVETLLDEIFSSFCIGK